MQVEFIRFNASDEVELQGWLSNDTGETAALHIHGMSGNGYKNQFLDSLRVMYARLGISFFAINTRGHGIISDFRHKDGWLHGGSCFEIFEESERDIQGALDYLKSLGKAKFILQGHSLGCSKAINFLINSSSDDIAKVVLLAPTDMIGWASRDPKHQEYLAKSKQLLDNGRGQELVGAECWPDKTPISAQTYPSICGSGNAVDIYGERKDSALLSRVNLPMLIAYGDHDIGITQVDETMDKWLMRFGKIKNPNTKTSIIQGAEHGFRNYEDELATRIEAFVKES